MSSIVSRFSPYRHLGHRLKNYFFPENTPEEIENEIVYAIEHEKDEIILPVMDRWLFHV